MSEANRCLTCYGAGEAVTESGPQVCPDCFGEGKQLSQSTKVEWRLRQIERAGRQSGREEEADLLWLVHELRRNRDALIRILALCQDAEESDTMAREVRHQANEALRLYETG